MVLEKEVMVADTSTDQRIATATPEGQPAPRRVPNASVAYGIYYRMNKDNEPVQFKNVRLRNQYDGHPPVSQAERIRKAMAWVPNINYGESRAIVDSNVSAQWQMFNNEPLLVTFEWTGYDADPREWGAIADRMAESYTCTLRDWDEWDYHLLLRLGEMNKYCNGPVFWRDEYTWKSEALQCERLLLPKRTRSLPSKVEECGIRDEIPFHKMFEYIEPEDAEEQGWNVSECRRVIAESAINQNKTDAYQEGDWATISHKIKNRDYESTTNEFDGVKVVHLLVTENTGTVSHYIIHDTKTMTGDGAKPEFMFKAEDRWESMKQAIHFLLFSIGDGYYYSIVPLLQQVFPTCDLSNRMLNALMTGAIMSSGLLVQATANFKAESMSIMHIGAAVAVDPNLTIQQSSFSPPIDKVAFARSIISGIQNNNVGMRKTYSENPDAKVTPTQINNEASNEAKFQMHQAAWLYAQFDAFHAETFRRLMNPDYPEVADGYAEQQKFIEGLGDVPAQYKDPAKWKVRAVRSVGMGSLQERRQIASMTWQMAQSGDETERKEAKKNWYSAWYHYSQVKRFVADIPRDQIADIQFQIAEGENADMMGGYQRTLGEMDNDRQHLRVHFMASAQLADQFAKNPMAAAQLAPQMKNLLEHEARHVGRMSKDGQRKNEVKQYVDILKKFSAMLQKAIDVANKIAKMQKESQGKQQKLSETMQLGMAKIQAETQVELERIKAMQAVEMEKARMLDASRQVKTQTAATATTEKAAAEIARENAKAIAEINREDAKTITALSRPSEPASVP